MITQIVNPEIHRQLLIAMLKYNYRLNSAYILTIILRNYE